MELTQSQRGAFQSILASFDNSNVTYVILRKYEDLPRSLPDDDIDIQIHGEDFDTALSICRSHGFSNEHSTTNNVVDLVRRAVGNPDKVTRWLLNKPKDTLQLVSNTTKPYSRGSHGYRSVKLELNGLILDAKKHLAYRSPMNRERIRVAPNVETKLLERRVTHDEFYVPSPPDRLAHLICHCLFDKEGTFPPYYVEKCNELVDEVSANKRYESQFEELLSELFFDAADLVAERVYSCEYDELLQDLYQFGQY